MFSYTKKLTMTLSIFFLAFLLKVLSSHAALETYVVFMDKAKMEALDVSLGTSRRWHEEIIESIHISSTNEDGYGDPTSSPNDHIRPRLHYLYEEVGTGFSAQLSEKHLESLKRVDGFLSATRDKLRTLHTTHSPQFLGLRERKGLWGAGNLASDVIIGMVDTGIWPEHRSFSGSGLSPVPTRWRGTCEHSKTFRASACNRKLIGARAFFKSYEKMYGRIKETSDYRSPRDSNGHGTHTASTAGGNLVKGASLLGVAKGTAAGMRPTARIAVYKVCYEQGCTDSDILAAMDQAIKDGVDVLSLSIGGSPEPYYDDPMAVGAFSAVRKGIIVSLSAGNSGPNSSSVSNAAPWMMTVAASYMDRSFPADVYLGDGKSFKGSSLFSGKPIKQLKLVYGKSANTQFCAKGSLSRRLVKGNIAICDRGGNISRVGKGEEVKRVGGAGMILANLQTDGEGPIADAHVLSAVSLGASAAVAVRKYTKSSKHPTATIVFHEQAYNNRAPIMASFSSRGPNSVDPHILKPDVTAPGVNILAAWPPNIGPSELKTDKRRVWFNILSGTSMSCPHVSGLIALLKSRHVDWSPAAIRSALMTTAYVHDSKGLPISDSASGGSETATPFAFGSGHVNPERASDPGLVYNISTRDYCNYLCSINYNSKQLAVFPGCRAGCGHFKPGDLNYPSFSVVFGIKDSHYIVTHKRTVTNVGIPVCSYSVEVIEPHGVSVTVEPKALKFRKARQKLSYKVTFKAKGKMSRGFSSFGSLLWVCGKYSVRSPIAATWLM